MIGSHCSHIGHPSIIHFLYFHSTQMSAKHGVKDNQTIYRSHNFFFCWRWNKTKPNQINPIKLKVRTFHHHPCSRRNVETLFKMNKYCARACLCECVYSHWAHTNTQLTRTNRMIESFEPQMPFYFAYHVHMKRKIKSKIKLNQQQQKTVERFKCKRYKLKFQNWKIHCFEMEEYSR